VTVPEFPEVRPLVPNDHGWISARLNGDLGNLGSTASVTVSFGWGTNPEADPEAYAYWTNPEVKTSTGAFYFDLSGLIPGTTYYYQVIPTNANGSGAPSNIASLLVHP
jgi:hypothetical protein